MAEELALKGTIDLDAEVSKAEKRIDEMGQRQFSSRSGVFIKRIAEGLSVAFLVFSKKFKTIGLIGAAKIGRSGAVGGAVRSGLQFGAIGTALGSGLGKTILKLSLVAAALGLVFVGFKLISAMTLGLAKKFLNVGRSLIPFSGAMAATFAVFDAKMLLIKKRMGDSLAPAFKTLTSRIAFMADSIMPIITFAFSSLLFVVNLVAGAFTLLLKAVRFGVGVASSIATDAAEGGGFGVSVPLAQAINNLVDAVLGNTEELKKQSDDPTERSAESLSAFFSSFIEGAEAKLEAQAEELRQNSRGLRFQTLPTP